MVKKSFLIILGIIIIVAVVTSNCFNRQIVYTCEDGSKVFDVDGCPMIEVPVEKPLVEKIVEQRIEPEKEVIREVAPVPSELELEVTEEQEEMSGEPMEITEATTGFTFVINNVSFTPRTITSVSYSAENNMKKDIDPYTVVYSIDLETQEKEFLDNFDLGGLKPGQTRDKEEGTTIRLKNREDQLLLFMVYDTDLSKGKVNIANVTHMLNYEETFGE